MFNSGVVGIAWLMTIADGSEAEIALADVIAKARAARQAGNREEALRWFQEATTRKPGDARLLFEVASELRELRRFEEAERVYGEVVAIDPDHAAAWRGAGLMARQRGDKPQALAHFQKAVAVKPDEMWSLQELATALREAGRLDEADATYAKAVGRDATFLPALRGRGLVARQRGDHAAALACFQAAIAAKPDDVACLQDVASELRELRRDEEAAAAYRAVLARDASFAPALRGLGLLARRQGAHDAALAHFQAAARANPRDVWAHQESATTLRELDRMDEAQAAYGQALARDSAFVPALRGLGLLARRRGDREGALRHFQQAATLRPSDAWIHQEIATELRELGRFDAARDAYRTALQKNPRFVHALRGLAIIARHIGDREEALVRFRAAAEASPDLWLWQEVATELIETGRFAEAEACAKMILRKSSRSARAWLLFVQCARSRLSGNLALLILKHAVAFEPQDVAALMSLAGEYQRRTRFADARALYERVLALQPRHVQAAFERAALTVKPGAGGPTIADLRAASSGSNFNEAGLLACARELGMRKAFAEAQACLDEILTRFPVHYAARMQGAALLRLQGDLRGASRAYARIAGHYPSRPEPLVEIAADAVQLGDPAEAVRNLALALKLRPGYAPALNAVAQLAVQSDQIETALAVYRMAMARQPHAIQPALGAASCLINLGRTADHEELMRRLERRHGKSLPLLNARAGMELSRGRYAEAAAIAESLRAASAVDFGSFVTRFNVYLRTGDLDAIERMLAEAPPFSAVNQDRLRLHIARYALARWQPDVALEIIEQEGVFIRNDDLAARAAFLAARWESLEQHLRSQLRTAASYRQLRNLPSHISQSHLGQLLDEARLEADAGARIAALRDLPPEARLPEAIDLARNYPDYTPAAICLFLELRRRGDLTGEAGGLANDASSPIPRRISQYWDAEEPPADVLAYCHSWRDLNRGFDYRRFSEAEARAFLAAHHPAEVLDAFEQAPEPAMKADLFRLALLLVQGGFYADADDRCLTSLDAVVPKDRDLVLYQEDLGTIANNFIGVVPGHPVIRLALEGAVAAIHRNDRDILWLSTGPGLVTRASAKVALTQHAQLDDFLARVRIFDNHEMRRILAPHCAASYKNSAKHWSRTVYKKVRAPVSQSLEALFEELLGA